MIRKSIMILTGLANLLQDYPALTNVNSEGPL